MSIATVLTCLALLPASIAAPTPRLLLEFGLPVDEALDSLAGFALAVQEEMAGGSVDQQLGKETLLELHKVSSRLSELSVKPRNDKRFAFHEFFLIGPVGPVATFHFNADGDALLVSVSVDDYNYSHCC